MTDNVQRAKSTRWLQSNVNYDGGDFGDDYDDWDDDYTNDDDDVPPLPTNVPDVPSIPQEFLNTNTSAGAISSISATHITPSGTPTLEEGLHHTKSNASNSSGNVLTHTQSNASNQRFVEAGVTKYSLQDGSGSPEHRAIEGEDSPEVLNKDPAHDNVHEPHEKIPHVGESEPDNGIRTSPLPGAWPTDETTGWPSQSQKEELPGSWPSEEVQEVPGSWPSQSTPSSSTPQLKSTDNLNKEEVQPTHIPQEELYPSQPANRQSTYDHEDIYDQYYDQDDEVIEEEPTTARETFSPPLQQPYTPPTDVHPQHYIESQPESLPEPHSYDSNATITPTKDSTAVIPSNHPEESNIPHAAAVPSLPPPVTDHSYYLQPTNTNEFYGETDSTASLSTGRRSMDSTVIDQKNRLSIDDNRPALHGRIAESVRNNPVMEDSEEEVNEQLTAMSLKQRPDLEDSDSGSSSDSSDSDSDVATTLAGRWRPDPIAVPPVKVNNPSESYSSPKQKDLENDILKTMNNSSSHVFDKSPSPAARMDDYSPDPELVQLVKNTRFSTHGFPEIKPLNTGRSKGSDSDHWGESSSDENDKQSEKDDNANDEHQHESSYDRELRQHEENQANETNNHEIIDSTLHAHAANNLSNISNDDSSSVATGVSELDPISPVSTNNERPRQPSHAASVLSNNTTIVNNPIAIKLNKLPTFDFTAALARPTIERKDLFDNARAQQCEYASNLQTWLAIVNSTSSNIDTRGIPPKPTQNQLKEDRTVSATFIKPAKTLTNQFGKVGEKSTKRAKGLLAMGKKFIGGNA